MSNVYEASKPTTETAQVPEKSGCGCWVWGCLSVVVIGIIGIALASYLLYRVAAGQIEKYTSETPQEMPVVEYDEETLTALETRFDDFKAKLKSGEPTEDLVLTAEDINAMIAKKEDLKGKIFVKIEDGQLKGDVSMPLDNLPLGVGKGRYFNASAAFDVTMANGMLVVNLADAEVKGEQVPEEFLQGMRKENLAKDLYNDPDTAKAFRRIESIDVEDGKVVLRVRKEKSADSENSDETMAGEGSTGDATEGDTPASDTPADDGAGEGKAEDTDGSVGN